MMASVVYYTKEEQKYLDRKCFLLVSKHREKLMLLLDRVKHPIDHETVTITTLYAPMRRYPVCFSLLLYYDATLPMLD
jgi:hypothetical protein